MINAKPHNSNEGNSSDDNFYENLTEGEPIDLDLFTACAIGEFEYVKTLIHAKSDTDIVNKSNSSGWTSLMYVCYVGNDKIVELLIREGADVLFQEDKGGCTPLMFAASSGNISLVKRLVEVSLSK
jgi:ankyrin repeat protein